MKRWITLTAVVLGLVALGCGSEDGANDPTTPEGGTTGGEQTAGATTGGEQTAPTTGEVTTTGETTTGQQQGGLTYYTDVKPLLDHMCVRCHGPGGVREQVPLDNYGTASGLAALIKQKITAREMPPWGAEDGCRDYAYDESLTEDEIATLSEWADSGAEMGDENAEPAAITIRQFAKLSREDVTLEMPVDYVMLQSPDDYRCFLIDWPSDTDTYITGFGAKPGNATVVHHIIAYLIPPDLAGQFAEYDELDDGPGYECFGGPNPTGLPEVEVDPTSNINLAFLGGWAPGGVGADFPPGTGTPVKQGSKVALQVHYNTLTDAPQPDRTAVVFKVDDQVEREAFVLPWTNFQWVLGTGMEIPAGEASVKHTFDGNPLKFNFPVQADALKLYSATLHMHVLGTAGSVSIERENGDEECLVSYENYDFNWQRSFGFMEQTVLTKNDTIHMECEWNNSPSNQVWVEGEQMTPVDQKWGEGTTDEMCVAFFFASVATPEEIEAAKAAHPTSE